MRVRLGKQLRRRLFRFGVAAAVPMALVTAGAGSAQAASPSVPVDCHSINFQVRSPTNGHAISNGTPVHDIGPYGDCPVNFTVSSSQGLVLRCYFDNEFSNRWFNVSLVGDGTRTGWVLGSYLFHQTSPGPCQ